MKTFLKKIPHFFEFQFFPLYLLLLAFLTYGILIPFLGFYWDDFPYSWFAHIGGTSGVFRAVAEDRPALGLLYGITLPLLGNNPLVWQLFGIFTHWLFSVCIFKIILAIWPTEGEKAGWIAALSLVYPGFSQHWISVIYSQAFLLFSLYFLSITLMIRAIKDKKKYWSNTIAAIVLSLFSMACSEYTAGLELLRPFIIFLVLPSNDDKKNFKPQLKKVFFKWIPYLASLVCFGIYRIFFATSVLYSVRITDDLIGNPFGLLVDFIQSSLNNLLNAGVIAWIKPFTLLANLNPSRFTDQMYILIVGLSLVFLFLIFRCIHKTINGQSSRKDSKWGKAAIFLGIAGIIAAGVPFFAVKYKLLLSFPYDRLSLPMILGSTLIIVGVVYLFIKRPVLKNIILILIISFSIGSQFLFANTYREDWDSLKNFFWQLHWRIPDIKKGTMLLTDKMPLRYYSDNSLTAPLNWLYEKPIENSELPLILNFLSVRVGNRIPNLQPNTPINQYYRIVNFIGNTSDSLVFQFAPPGCVHILDPYLDRFNPSLSLEISSAIHLSNFSRILDTVQLKMEPLKLLGDEPVHNWCYYYQKAELAKQSSQWTEIVNLGKLAFSLNDYPNDPIERFPFIEAYAHTGNYQKALELSQKTIEISPLYNDMLCALWKRIDKTTSTQPIPEEINQFLTDQLHCE